MATPEKEFEHLERRFFDEWVKRNPLLGTAFGLHQYDDQMPDGRPQKEVDDIRFLERSVAEFEAVNPKGLSPTRQVDRELAMYTLRLWIFERAELRLGELNPEAPHVVGRALFQILSRHYAPLKERLRTLHKRLEATLPYLEQMCQRMKTPVRQFMENELETLSRLPAFFNMIRDVAREQIPATAEKLLFRAVEDVQTALDEYENWLIVDAKPLYADQWWIGEEKFRKLLALRGIEEAPITLVHMAEAELERLREKLREIGHHIKRKVVIEDVRDIVRQQHPEGFDAALRYIRDQVQKVKQFVSRSKFAPLPDHDTLIVTEMPSYLCHVLPWGTYSPPARFEAKHEGYFYVTSGDCDSDKLKELNYPQMVNLAIHETYPGHHLQAMWQVRTASLCRLLFAQAPETHEGWAHYCEERIHEAGFENTVNANFMTTLEQILRWTRVIMDVKLSTGKMGYQEGIEYLIDAVGMDRICAEAELRRYIVTPGVPLSYAYGRQKILELRKWAKEKMRSRWDETFFHHALLLAGALPFHLLKRDLEWRIEEELKRPAPKEEEKHPKHGKGEKSTPAHAKIQPHSPKRQPQTRAATHPTRPVVANTKR